METRITRSSRAYRHNWIKFAKAGKISAGIHICGCI